MAREDYDEKQSFWKVLKPIVSASSIVSIIFVSIIILIFSVFVFGDRGSYSNANVAELLSTIGIGVLSAIVATVIDRSVSARDLESRITRNFREAAGVASSLIKLGVQTAHAEFDFGRIFKEARRGETVSWLDTYCPRQNEFIDDVIDALRRGVQVRMLIVDPNCDNARFRNQELESTFDTGGGWTGGLDAFISKMSAVAGRGYGKFEIRYYRDLPCVPMYLVGKSPTARKGYFSIFLVRATAGCQHLELTRGDWLTDMARYFESKWERQATTPPPSVASTG